MSKSSVTLDEVLEETGLAAKWKARGKLEGKLERKLEGKLEGKLEVARNCIRMGISPEQVAEAAGLELETIKALI